MKTFWSMTVVAAWFLALLAFNCSQPAPDTRVADEAAIRGINPNWFKAYNAGDVNGILALYADDAVVNGPGSPAARGEAAIREYFTKDIAGASAAGVKLNSGPSTDDGVSGDLGWEWGTYTATDKSGATVDKGKYVTVCARRNGKWLVIRDIWNSDGQMKAPASQ